MTAAFLWHTSGGRDGGVTDYLVIDRLVLTVDMVPGTKTRVTTELYPDAKGARDCALEFTFGDEESGMLVGPVVLAADIHMSTTTMHMLADDFRIGGEMTALVADILRIVRRKGVVLDADQPVVDLVNS